MTGWAIAIGGSSGSFEPIKQLLAQLPANLEVPVFVVVHVGSQGRNLLAAALGQHGCLPVKTAVEGERVEPGVVYIAPANFHLLVINRIIHLGRGPRENLARPAVDPTFRSVAATYGSATIAIVASGHLNDGAAGLADVKRCGGTTIVQDPGDATVPDMPLGALRASDVDYRGPVSKMKEILSHVLAQEPGPMVPVPRDIVLEIDIALGKPCLTETINQIGSPVALSCPDCSGVLSQMSRKPLRFRCQVGHGFTAEALAAQQEVSISEAIRVALRIVEERAHLLERMGHDAVQNGRRQTAETFLQKVTELREHAEVLRRAAISTMTDADADLRNLEPLSLGGSVE